MASVAPTPQVVLRKREERRLLAGHLWIYANEVDPRRSPLNSFKPGDSVDIHSHNGRWLGNGYINPHSLICARIVSRERAHPLTQSLIVHRLNVALSLRQRLFDKPYYRLIYGEGDGLPGLVIDRYEQLYVVQLSTAGMEKRRHDVLAAIEKVLDPAGVLLRCDQDIRELEGLDRYVEAIGDVPQEKALIEHDVKFEVPILRGQKTGWYFDQRDNRHQTFRLAKGKRVLDLCSYVGAWGIQAVKNGALHATCVDSSENALDYVRRNAIVNHIAKQVTGIQGDVFDVLKTLREDNRRFGVVVVDPPAFIKRKKDTRSGRRAYQRLNQAALQVLEKDGLLITCSCSFHMPRDEFLRDVHQAARHIDRNLQLLAEGGQAMDHPIHPAMPETRYLKCLFLRVLPRSW